MTVEFRAVHAGEFGFSANTATAGSAHTHAVNHDGVQADSGLDAERLGYLGDRFHHGHGADGHYFGYVFVLFKTFTQEIGDKPFVSGTAVISGNEQLRGAKVKIISYASAVL